MDILDVIRRVCEGQGWMLRGSEIDMPLADGRAQRVTVQTFADGGDSMVRITTGVGDAAQLSEAKLLSALRVNHGLAHGALAIRDDHLVLTDTFLASEATPDQFERSLRFLATTADRYERVMFGTDQH